MKKTWIIARKELLSTFRQRNLVLIMFLSPIVLVTIIGLAFGGLGSGAANFADIPVAVVNLDQNVTLPPGLRAGDLSLNFGSQLAASLLSQPPSGPAGDLDLSELSCPLLPNAEADTDAGALDWLLDAVAVDDPAAARAGVSKGDFAAAVIIPPDFSRRMLPQTSLTAMGLMAVGEMTTAGTIEVYANPATAISAGIVRAVVEGIASRYERVSVAASALLWATDGGTASSVLPNAERGRWADLMARAVQTGDVSVLEPLGCLLTPQAGAVQIRQQPVDQAQAQSPFGVLMVVIGGAQAVFFALFTGVFGINAIYEDRTQGTLQRLLVSPTPSSVILAGRLLGNLAIVMAQLLILLLAFTAITSIVEWQWRFIWGDNLPALLLVVLGLSLFTTGLGVLIVGLANSSEQVQLIGPVITILLSALSGSFGFGLPRSISQLSPIWWGLDAMRKLAGNEPDIGLHLLVLFSAGAVFAGIGTFFFRRRMGL